MSRPLIQIEGLTERQVNLLNIIYACDDYEELMTWAGSLPMKTRFEVLSLIQLILHETIEEEMVKPMTSYPDAERIIEKVRRKK